MSSRRSIERWLPRGGLHPAPAGRVVASVIRGLACVALSVVVCACASSPPGEPPSGTKPATAAAAAAEQNVGAAKNAPPGSAQAGPGAASAGAAASAPAAPTEIPRRAVADFDRAVGMMRSGNATEAELEFKQISVSYPQLSAPYVNLGILLRKGGQLEQSEDALKRAVERNGASAVAWTELGATQRLRGKFLDAAASYEKAIAADPNYAAAYRNLGVVSDLYLADPERALTAFERYKELTGEDKPVSGWLAELRQRLGKPVQRPAAPAAAPGSDAPAAPAPETPSPAAPAPSVTPGAPGAPDRAPPTPAPRAGG